MSSEVAKFYLIFFTINMFKCKCIEFKRDEGVGKMFLIFSKFSRKGPIDLNATFDQSPDEILVLLRKPRKPRFANEFV